MTFTFGLIVVHQMDRNDDLVETHVFPDHDALGAWLDSQEVTVYLHVEPREELIGQKVSTFPDLDLVAIQRRNAAINRTNAERLRDLGEHSAAEGWYRLADEADAAADRMETEQ